MQKPRFRYSQLIPVLITLVLMIRWIFNLDTLRHGGGFHPRYLIDAEVYRVGGTALLDHVPLYDASFPLSIDFSLPFTYPPFAAIIFAGLALLPLGAGMILITLMSLACLWLCIFLVLREVMPQRDYVTWCLWATAAACLSEPVTETFDFGQVNLILAALVLLDFFVLRHSKFQGTLIGIAIAIKLTPAVFLAVFFVRRQWRALFTGIGSFIACGAIGFLITPKNSLQYWTSTLRDSNRIGNLDYTANQSLRGFLARVTPQHAETLWLLGSLLIVVALWLIMDRLAHQGKDGYHNVVLVLLASSAALMCSPVSWSHHFVWLVFAAIALTARRQWILAALTWFVVVARGHWRVPFQGVEQDWTLWQQIPGNDYFWLTLLLLCAAGALALSSDTTSREPATF